MTRTRREGPANHHTLYVTGYGVVGSNQRRFTKEARIARMFAVRCSREHWRFMYYKSRTGAQTYGADSGGAVLAFDTAHRGWRVVGIHTATSAQIDSGKFPNTYRLLHRLDLRNYGPFQSSRVSVTRLPRFIHRGPRIFRYR